MTTNANLGIEEYRALLLNIRRREEVGLGKDYLAGQMGKLQGFLERTVHLSYDALVANAHPENMTGDSYRLFGRPALKKSLFEHRAKLYLVALAEFEEAGGNIDSILEEIRGSELPTIKRTSGTEPTFEAIYKVFKRK